MATFSWMCDYCGYSTDDPLMFSRHYLNGLPVCRRNEIRETSYLKNLALDYLDAVGIEYSIHQASLRSTLHEQILQALGKTREDDFDAVLWAREMVAGR